MKNKDIYLTLGIIFSVIAIPTILLSTNHPHLFVRSIDNSYTLLLNGNNTFVTNDSPNNNESSGVVKTSSNNNVTWNYLHGYKTNNELVTLDNNGYIENDSLIKGMTSISISASEEVALSYAGVNTTISDNTEISISCNHLRITSLVDNTVISSITIKYSCVEVIESIYEYEDNGNYYLLTNITDKTLSSYDIPSTYQGKNVIMDQGIFEGCTNVASINVPSLNNHVLGYYFKTGEVSTTPATVAGYIPNTLTSVTVKSGDICDNCFRTIQSITNVTLLNTSIIHQRGFEGMGSLSSIYLNDGLETIEQYTFNNTGIIDIFIPISVTTIGKSVFQSNAYLETIRCEVSSKPSGWSNSWFGAYENKVSWGESR